MIALAVVAVGVALVAAIAAWSLTQPRTRCAWCGEPTRDRLLFHPECQLLWETAP